MSEVSLIGCGYVADLYMRSFKAHPRIRVLGAHDRDAARQAAFCAHWGLTPLPDAAAACAALPHDGLVLNLTNPKSHAAITRGCLRASRHVWSEKPMVTDMETARELHDLARARGLQLATAPSSVLSQSAQGLGRALRMGVGGPPRLIYAELDDGFVPRAPYHSWASESGAPWPAEDEFATGCTLEHAGYWLSWLIAHFGPVARVVAAAAEVIPDKPGVRRAAPDFSVAALFFESGPVARLTCSIAAPHDHRLRVIGDEGVIEVARAWDNHAPVRYRRRMRLRRRLLESPLVRDVSLKGAHQSKPGRRGAAKMDFALGPIEMLDAISQGRESRLAGAYALHLTEVTLAIQEGAVREMTTRCDPMEPMPWAL
ncbi:Gfo/Idh/MocA family oxidoreductase [uncultured Limimaricola sp.]|uniref:Gfo/Idh/MocA family protein n=1 Tax=uncultured Limimaricola sp. TaxID=2211667 RepID=UPI0030FD1FAD